MLLVSYIRPILIRLCYMHAALCSIADRAKGPKIEEFFPPSRNKSPCAQNNSSFFVVVVESVCFVKHVFVENEQKSEIKY